MSALRRPRLRSLVLPCVSALFALSAVACDTKFYTALGEKVSVAPVAISPATTTVPANGSLTFTASGGSPPYTFSMASGLGSVNAATGAFVASGTAGTEYVQVRDSRGGTSRATIAVVSTTGPLALTPPTVSLNAGGTVTFVASGGTPPYTFSISGVGSAPPSPSIGATTGAYAAGSNIGTDTVKVVDASAASTTATVTITAAVSNVDYAIPMETLPGAGTAGTALPGGFSFTVQNVGSGNGGQPVSWWVFLSPAPAPGSGTVLLESGTTPALAAGASTAVPLSWMWPSVPPVLPGQTRYLYIMISASDDLTTANNTFSGPALTLAPSDIDYTVASVSSTGGTQAGNPLAGSFTLQNSGTAAGSQSVSWTAYVSTDSTATIDGGAIPLASGTTAALAAGGTQPVTFSGTWPAAAGTYYLKAAVSAPDEVNTANDVQVSAAVATTIVDYASSGVTNTGGLVGGSAMSGSFTATNTGSANGAQTITWSVYISTTPTLGIGSTLAASGTHAALNAGQSTPIPFGGTWPAAGGTYYLIASVSASDDPDTANNQAVSPGLAVTSTNVDYAPSGVTNTGALVGGGAMAGSFTVTNGGSANGSQTVSWAVYISTTPALGVGSTLAASGTHAALNSGQSTPIGFAGTWPAAGGTYYLIATVSAVDDSNAANNQAASASLAVAATNVDYAVSAVTNTGGLVSGSAMAGSFTLTNSGSGNGTQTVSWTVYISTTPTAGAGSTLAASGTTAAMNSGQSTPIPFSGSWPAAAGTWYLVAAITASDDSSSANNQAASGGLAVTPASVDYKVLSVAVTGGLTDPAAAMTGNLQFSNIGVNNGTQLVTWQVYASHDTVLDGSDVLIASGTNPPLTSGASSPVIPFSGNWPLTYGPYYLMAKVTVTADVDINPANNVAASGSSTTIGEYVDTEPNNDINLVTVQVLPVTLKPGMSIQVTGNLNHNLGDAWDVFQFNTGTAASVTFTWTWAGSASVGMYVLVSPATYITGVTTTATSLSLPWSPVDLPNTARWIGLNDTSGLLVDPGNYTLIINAN